MAEVRSTAPTSTLTGALRLVDYWATVYARTWKGSAVGSFLLPLLYLLAMGVLLGGFIEADPSELEGAPSYVAFVAPGLLASQAMQLAIGEMTYPVMGMVKWQKIYFGMQATPLAVRDMVLGHVGFVLFRVASSCAVFCVAIAPFGVFESVPGALGAFVVQVLIGLAFATPVFAFSAGLKDESAFSLVFRLVMIPLFLFSGAFFPVGNLDPWMEALAKATPLWHGVDLTRMLALDQVDWSLAGLHVLYLLALGALGWWWAIRRLTARLVS